MPFAPKYSVPALSIVGLRGLFFEPPERPPPEREAVLMSPPMLIPGPFPGDRGFLNEPEEGVGRGELEESWLLGSSFTERGAREVRSMDQIKGSTGRTHGSRHLHTLYYIRRNLQKVPLPTSK